MSTSQTWRRLLTPNVLLGLAAIGAGALAAWGASGLLRERAAAADAAATRRLALRPVVVAARDIAAGQVLGAGQLALRPMPAAWLPADAAAGHAAGSLVGRRALVPIARGEPVTPRVLAAMSAPLLSGQLAVGQRAVTLPVDEPNALAGLLRAGDRVDLHYAPDAGAGEARLVPLLERVQVLATGDVALGQPVAEAAPGFASITLALSADDAARVVLAQRAGRVHVVLRGPDDVGQGSMRIRSSRDLGPAQVAQPPSVRPRATGRIEFIVGGGRSALPMSLVSAALPQGVVAGGAP